MRTSKRERQYRLLRRLQEMGFTFEEAQKLRRIEMTLQDWAEQECGNGDNYASWSIERDEATGKPFRCIYPHQGKARKHAIADRESGALRRLAQIMADKPDLEAYHQSDPRGCALYIVRKSDIGEADINSVYTRGLAVCE